MGLEENIFLGLREDIEKCILAEVTKRFGERRTVNFINEVIQDNPSKGHRYKVIFMQIIAAGAA